MFDNLLLEQNMDRISKCISIIGYIFICCGTSIIFFCGPSTRYEFSIYDVYPTYFWGLLISATVIGQLLIFKDIFRKSEKRWWLHGFILILLSDTIQLFLPLIRGYHSTGIGDVMTQIADMLDIIYSGVIGQNNQYPADHLIGVVFNWISGISLSDVTMIIPPIFSLFFIISMYVLGRNLFSDRRLPLLIVIFATPLYFGSYHVHFLPNAQAMMLLPLNLFILAKIVQGNCVKQFVFILTVMSILLVFFHPLITVMNIIILITANLIQRLISYMDKKDRTRLPINYALLLSFCFFVLWERGFVNVLKAPGPFFSYLLGTGTTSSIYESYSKTISTVSIDIGYLIRLALNMYGQYIVMAILSLLCFGIVLFLIKEKSIELPFFLIFSIAGFFIFGFSTFVLFFSGITFNFDRVLKLMMIFSMSLIPFTAMLVLRLQPLRSWVKISIVVGLFICVVMVSFFSTFNLYDSPRIKQANQQVTVSEFQGMTTFFEIRDETIPIIEHGLYVFRYYQAIFGVDATQIQGLDETNAIDHFGYGGNTTLGGESGIHYLLMNTQGRYVYQNVYPEFSESWRFTPTDYNHLDNDNQIHLTYENGNLQVYEIVRSSR